MLQTSKGLFADGSQLVDYLPLDGQRIIKSLISVYWTLLIEDQDATRVLVPYPGRFIIRQIAAVQIQALDGAGRRRGRYRRPAGH